MPIHAIETDADLTAALARLDELWGAKLGTPEGDELDALADLIVAYENRAFPAATGEAASQGSQ